jgi:hypothetical protein
MQKSKKAKRQKSKKETNQLKAKVVTISNNAQTKHKSYNENNETY